MRSTVMVAAMAALLLVTSSVAEDIVGSDPPCDDVCVLDTSVETLVARTMHSLPVEYSEELRVALQGRQYEIYEETMDDDRADTDQIAKVILCMSEDEVCIGPYEFREAESIAADYQDTQVDFLFEGTEDYIVQLASMTVLQPPPGVKTFTTSVDIAQAK